MNQIKSMAAGTGRHSARLSGVLLLFVVGLLIVNAYFGGWRNQHMFFFVRVPSVVGAYGIACWIIWETLFRSVKTDSVPGAIVSFGVLVGVAIVIGGML